MVFGWYLDHLESPITPDLHLVLIWITHTLSLPNLIYSSLILLHIFSVIPTVSPALVYGISAVLTDNHFTDVGTLILVLLRYGFD